MSTQKVITITVDPATGVADYASEGFVGPHCTEPAAWARSILGTPLREEKTAEFYQIVTAQRQHHVQRRR